MKTQKREKVQKQETRKKEIMKRGSKEYYLLGSKEGYKIWLQSPSWDCGWYWGFGYVQTFNRPYTDTISHQHFDSLFFRQSSTDFFKFFGKTTLNEKETWILLELMKTAYNLRSYADVLSRGGSHYTENPLKELIKNDDEMNRINRVVLPSIFEKIRDLFVDKEEAQE